MAQSILKINQSSAGKVVILALNGELDAKTAPDFRTQLDKLIEAGSVNLVLDCKGLSYVASAGIGTLNAILKTATSKNGELVLSNVQKDIKDTMELMYFTKKVKIFSTTEEAIQKFS
jgi:anti-sigma B factor antagonist